VLIATQTADLEAGKPTPELAQNRPMWLPLGGSYWQRASWAAVAVIAAALGLFAYWPALAPCRPRHWVTATLILALIITFFYLLARSLQHAERIMLSKLERIEQQRPR
jgi:sterol desaturase/sphingolipid hydroxylase (fatty acid hydroxylase superfamily)